MLEGGEPPAGGAGGARDSGSGSTAPKSGGLALLPGASSSFGDLPSLGAFRTRFFSSPALSALGLGEPALRLVPSFSWSSSSRSFLAKVARWRCVCTPREIPYPCPGRAGRNSKRLQSWGCGAACAAQHRSFASSWGEPRVWRLPQLARGGWGLRLGDRGDRQPSRCAGRAGTGKRAACSSLTRVPRIFQDLADRK